ncbi:GDP-mannose 4,6-dehydratase [Candidatus Kaiserbacteria bacterium]|nr:GDP-mannose 4,6-dehydratase [Candidatus Kaiserbacteria bacterium]
MSDKKKTILVTGGAGALGSVVCKRYLDEGHRVICIDNLMKTRDTQNIDSFLHHPNFHFIKHDIIEPISFSGEKIDWIFNLACPVSCISLQIDPIHTMLSCTQGVANMLELARKHKATILQASSADIYGEMGDHPFRETDDYASNANSLSARSCYEKGKRAAETLLMDHHRIYGTDIKIARIFNTAGPHTQMTDGRIPSVFIYNALGNRDIIIYGDGSATRCFVHVDDQVEGLDRLMKKIGFYGPVNIGSTEEVTVKHLAQEIIRKTGSKSNLVFEKADDAPLFRKPDTTLAHSVLGWKPTKSLDTLLDDMIAHYKTIGLPESRILVFATTYYPDGGSAEERLAMLAREMPETEFHVITSKFRRGLKGVERMDNVTVYRIGFGTRFDKFLLPLFGALKAKELDRKLHFRFMWSLMASYGALAGVILKLLGSHASFIIAHHASEVYTSSWKKRIAAYVEGKADHIYQGEDMQGTNELIDRVRHKYKEMTMKQEGKLIRPV